MGAPLVQLDLLGNDRVGIVRDITRALHQVGVNVERLRIIAAKCPVHRTLESEVSFEETVELV